MLLVEVSFRYLKKIASNETVNIRRVPVYQLLTLTGFNVVSDSVAL